jgi:hypothetical protein
LRTARSGDLRRTALWSQCGHDVKFDEIVVDGGAGTEFKAVTDFVAEGVERIGGTETRRAALHAFALGHEAVAARIHCNIKSHAAGSLRLDIDAVNDVDLAVVCQFSVAALYERRGSWDLYAVGGRRPPLQFSN